MGCQTSTEVPVIETAENKRIKELSYRHTVRMVRYMFDLLDFQLFKNQYEEITDTIDKMGDLIRDVILLCQQKIEEVEFVDLKPHMDRWFRENDKEVGQLIEEAKNQEGEDDKERLINTIKRLQEGEATMRDAFKTYAHEWYTTLCYIITPFQQIQRDFLMELKEMIEIMFNVEQLPEKFLYDINEYPLVKFQVNNNDLEP